MPWIAALRSLVEAHLDRIGPHFVIGFHAILRSDPRIELKRRRSDNQNLRSTVVDGASRDDQRIALPVRVFRVDKTDQRIAPAVEPHGELPVWLKSVA